MPASQRKTIAILGAGFGGLYVARELLAAAKHDEIELVIINKTNFFLFTPLLHEVATGGLSYGSISISLREIFPHRNVLIYEGNIETVHVEKKMVSIAGKEISYDRLIIATGAETNYYGIAGAETIALSLKSLEDALSIKNQVIERFEEAMLCDGDKRRQLLTFVTVGGGATGVELASEIAQFSKILVQKYFTGISLEELSLHLISASPEILPQFSPKLRESALLRLKQQGITVHLGMAVKEVTAEGVMTDAGMIASKNVFWMAGVKPSLPRFTGTIPALSRSGRIITNEYLQTKDHADIFAIGDAATMLDADNKEIPMLAQAATQEASVLAENIFRSLRGEKLTPFSFKNKGALISLGQWFAVGEIYKLKIAGMIAWWLWRTVYLLKFPLWRKRFRIAAEWTANIFYPRDLTKPE